MKNKTWHIANNNIFFVIGLILLTSFAAFIVFPGLNYNGLILEWDEARHGISAYEMLKSNDYLVNTFQYEPDYWNAKPPLSIWMTVLGYKLFGFNTFGLRFFSALCLPIVVFITVLVLKNRVGIIAATVSGFLLAVCGGRMPHLFTTGDPDALFFTFSFLTCMFLYSASKQKPFFLIGAGICAAFAFLTKAMHVVSLFFVFTAYLTLAVRKRTFSVKQIILYLLLPMTILVFIWAVCRFYFDGMKFFRHMFINDVINRVTTVVENHSGDISFYINVFRRFAGSPSMAFFILLLGFWLFDRASEKFLNKNKNLPPLDMPFLTIFSSMTISPFIIFTLSTTKIAWYIYPSLIGFCFLGGYAAQSVFTRLNGKKKKMPIVLFVCFITAGLVYGGVSKPYQGSAASFTTNVNSGMSIFTKIEIEKGTSYIAVDSNGAKINSMNSWLLQSYFMGMEYLPVGIEEFSNVIPSMVALRYAGQSELDSFLQKYSGLKMINQITEYTGAYWALLEYS